MGASNAGGVGKNRDSRPLSGFLHYNSTTTGSRCCIVYGVPLGSWTRVRPCFRTFNRRQHNMKIIPNQIKWDL